MTRDGAKFNLAKLNLIGRIQFKHKKLHNVHVVQDWCFLIGFRVLFSWYMMEYQLFGSKKHTLA